MAAKQGVAPSICQHVDQEQASAALGLRICRTEHWQARGCPVHHRDAYSCRARTPDNKADRAARGVAGGVRDQFRDDQLGGLSEVVQVPGAEGFVDELAAYLGCLRPAREGLAVGGVANGGPSELAC